MYNKTEVKPVLLANLLVNCIKYSLICYIFKMANTTVILKWSLRWLSVNKA